ncbi:MAG: patatin-like phospholipase family protein [Deltaproteobacteria bacterium]|nr:patatin-like phospholipase family protein [Deltaproteobacteria bacterium]MBW2070827.1 patatin-like phospholipase family protein [Deltaproteobacteria bacterium]
MSTYRILSLDGGGIRGLLTAIILERLLAQVVDFLDMVDLIAGTSTGGILALGLARGRSPSELRKLYQEQGKKIFDDSFWDDLVDLGKLRGADYDNRGLRSELKKTLGSRTTLADLDKKVLITAFDLDNKDPHPARRTWKPKLFHNFPGIDSDGDALAYKVALYTSAAPTYFPSVDGFIDGGVFANNPSMAALAQCQDPRTHSQPPAMEDIRLLSLGTGTSLTYITGKKLDWGYTQWAKPLISLMMDGAMGIVDFQCAKMLHENYHRLAPVFPPGTSIPLDNVDKVPEIIDFAQAVDISATVHWLQDHWI